MTKVCVMRSSYPSDYNMVRPMDGFNKWAKHLHREIKKINGKNRKGGSK